MNATILLWSKKMYLLIHLYLGNVKQQNVCIAQKMLLFSYYAEFFGLIARQFVSVASWAVTE